ncbi:MAG: hypothetical protein FJW31_00785 [Acidobacteria bacterium]|nr:hypothetical protein [Acidobacteriota bacterium]
MTHGERRLRLMVLMLEFCFLGGLLDGHELLPAPRLCAELDCAGGTQTPNGSLFMGFLIVMLLLAWISEKVPATP